MAYFRPYKMCQYGSCAKPSAGEVLSVGGSYGHYCKKCAKKKLKEISDYIHKQIDNNKK